MSIKKITTSSFVRNVVLLASGTIAAQAVVLLLLPVLTRLYGPSDFGLLGVFVAITAILTVAACLRLDMATPLPERDDEAINLVILGCIAATVISSLIAVAIVLAPDLIISVLQQSDLKPYLWLVPICVWLAAIYSALMFWSIRKKRFGSVAITQLTRAIGGTGSQTGLGIVGVTPGGLVFGQAIYLGLGWAGLAGQFLRSDAQLLKTVTRRTLLETFQSYRRFPIYSVPESLLNTAANSVPIILIGALVGKEEAGFMLVAQRVASIPTGLLGSSLSRVFLAESGERQRTGELGGFTRHVMFRLLQVGLIPFVALAIIAPSAFPLIFGSGWERAGEMVTWMVPYMMLQLIVSPVSTLLHTVGNQWLALKVQALGFTLLVGAPSLTAFVGSDAIFASFAIAATFYYSAYLMAVLSVSRK